MREGGEGDVGVLGCQFPDPVRTTRCPSSTGAIQKIETSLVRRTALQGSCCSWPSAVGICRLITKPPPPSLAKSKHAQLSSEMQRSEKKVVRRLKKCGGLRRDKEFGDSCRVPSSEVDAMGGQGEGRGCGPAAAGHCHWSLVLGRSESPRGNISSSRLQVLFRGAVGVCTQTTLSKRLWMGLAACDSSKVSQSDCCPATTNGVQGGREKEKRRKGTHIDKVFQVLV